MTTLAVASDEVIEEARPATSRASPKMSWASGPASGLSVCEACSMLETVTPWRKKTAAATRIIAEFTSQPMPIDSVVSTSSKRMSLVWSPPPKSHSRDWIVLECR